MPALGPSSPAPSCSPRSPRSLRSGTSRAEGLRAPWSGRCPGAGGRAPAWAPWPEGPRPVSGLRVADVHARGAAASGSRLPAAPLPLITGFSLVCPLTAPLKGARCWIRAQPAPAGKVGRASGTVLAAEAWASCPRWELGIESGQPSDPASASGGMFTSYSHRSTGTEKAVSSTGWGWRRPGGGGQVRGGAAGGGAHRRAPRAACGTEGGERQAPPGDTRGPCTAQAAAGPARAAHCSPRTDPGHWNQADAPPLAAAPRPSAGAGLGPGRPGQSPLPTGPCEARKTTCTRTVPRPKAQPNAPSGMGPRVSCQLLAGQRGGVRGVPRTAPQWRN